MSPNLANKTLFTVLIRILIQDCQFDKALEYVHLGMRLYYNMTAHMVAVLFYSGKVNESLEYYVANKKNITDSDLEGIIPGFLTEFLDYNQKVFLTDVDPTNLDLLELQLFSTFISIVRGGTSPLQELYKNHWRVFYYLLNHDDKERVYDFFIRVFPVLCQDDADAMKMYNQYNQDVLDKSDVARDKMIPGIVHIYGKKMLTLFVGWCNQIDLQNGTTGSQATKDFLLQKVDDVIDILENMLHSDKYTRLWQIQRNYLVL